MKLSSTPIVRKANFTPLEKGFNALKVSAYSESIENPRSTVEWKDQHSTLIIECSSPENGRVTRFMHLDGFVSKKDVETGIYSNDTLRKGIIDGLSKGTMQYCSAENFNEDYLCMKTKNGWERVLHTKNIATIDGVKKVCDDKTIESAIAAGKVVVMEKESKSRTAKRMVQEFVCAAFADVVAHDDDGNAICPEFDTTTGMAIIDGEEISITGRPIGAFIEESGKFTEKGNHPIMQVKYFLSAEEAEAKIEELA